MIEDDEEQMKEELKEAFRYVERPQSIAFALLFTEPHY